jgi:hypothetical protein
MNTEMARGACGNIPYTKTANIGNNKYVQAWRWYEKNCHFRVIAGYSRILRVMVLQREKRHPFPACFDGKVCHG